MTNTTTAKIESRNKLSKALNELLKKRWSPRAFAAEKSSVDEIQQIFEAGKQVASSYNEQPWSVIMTDKGTQEFDNALSSLTDFNQKWAHTAPHLGIVLSKKNFSDSGDQNVHRFYDTGAFLSVATLQATALDLCVHQMAGFSKDKVKKLFSIPEGFEVSTVFALGKIGDPDDLPEQLEELESPESERKDNKEFLFHNDWGETY